MYRNETLQLQGDSIWGRITLLISSLMGRPCTGLERAQFYEIILLNSLKKQEEETPLQSMIDEVIVLFNKEDDGNRAKKFVSLLRKLCETSDSGETIIRFLLSLSRISDNYTDKCQINTSPCYSGSEIFSFWKKTMKNHLPTSVTSANHRVRWTKPFTDRTNEPLIIHPSHIEGNKQAEVGHELCFCGQKTVPIDTKLSEGYETYEEIRSNLVDERGRIHPLACGPELRSLCKLRIGDVFYIISYHEYLRSLTHALMGEESILFRKNADGVFSFSRKNKIFLELEDIDLLPRLSSPFLKFANRLFSLERFLRDPDSVENLSMFDRKILQNKSTRALLSLKLCVSEKLWKFRNEVRQYFDSKRECNGGNIRKVLRKLLDMCNIFNHFVDVVLHVQATGAQNVSTLLDIFHVVKVTKGRINSAVKEFCDDILVVLLRYYAECILVWLVNGEADPSDGVFCFPETNAEMLQWAVSGEKGCINLEAPMLIAENFVNTWLSEGKFRKLILAWPHLKQLVQEGSNDIAVNKLINEVSEEEIRKALNSNFFGAVGSFLDLYFRKVYLSQQTIFARSRIIDDFKQTTKVLQDVYLCGDEFITEIFVSVILNGEDGSELSFKSGIDQNCCLDKALDYLLTKNYSPTLVHGFFQLATSSNRKDDLKVRYKPSFPLNIIFPQSVLMDYEHIWNLLLRIAAECTALEKMMVQNDSCIYSITMMQMRMWSFVRAMRCFFHDQIRCLVVNEYQKNLDEIKTIGEAFQLHRRFVKKLYRHCLLGWKHVMLWNVLNECLLLITKYRRCSTEAFNILKLFKIFYDFHTNVDLFCNAVKKTSVGANYWLSDILLLADFPGIYADLQENSFSNQNLTITLNFGENG